MTVKKLASLLNLETLSIPEGEKKVSGGYTGDLLSWVMGKVSEGAAWITIMSNINVVAVASLRDVACVILSENSEADNDMLKKAEEEGINILRGKESSFDLCVKLGKILENE